jgi:glutamine synthetase
MNLETLKKKIAAGEVDTMLVVFPDVMGRLMGKRATARFFMDNVLKHGTHACNYLLVVNMEMDPVDGFALANWDKGFGDFAMTPDLNSLRLIPWQPGAALVMCDLYHHNGKIIDEAPRSVLRNQVATLARKGLVCKVASELEFFMFNHTYHDAFAGNYANLTPSSDYRIDYHTMQPTRDEPVMRAMRQMLEAAEIPVETTKGEWGKGQHEINMVYDDPLPMCDQHMVFKQALKDIAAQHGKCVTFMPKFSSNEAGSSCHIHISLWQKGKNLFWDQKKHANSKLFRQFLGGLMKYTPELAYFLAPTINAYKRYQPLSWAPTKMVWASDNRTVGFRVVGHEESARIENRMPGADTNPYLAFAAMIVAGMAGIEEKLDCGPIYEGNAYVDSKLPALPHSLRDAAELLDKSRLARKAFGDHVIDFYVHTARSEVQAFDNAVTDWERMRYFERI